VKEVGVAEEAVWRVKRVNESHLEDTLNQFESEGFQVFQIFPVQTAAEPEQYTVVARHIVVKSKRGMGF